VTLQYTGWNVQFLFTILERVVYIYTGGAKKYIHILRDTWTLWSTLLKQQFAVTTLGTSYSCRSQTWLVFIFCYRYILSITILIRFFLFLKCVHICLAPSVYLAVKFKEPDFWNQIGLSINYPWIQYVKNPNKNKQTNKHAIIQYFSIGVY
jgi:hypothetical protein